MKVTVEMMKNLGMCGPASEYVGQWFVDNNIEIIDYDLGMYHLKSLISHGQNWIKENVSDEEHSDYVNWIAWYEKLPTMLEALTYFNDHVVENTFKTTSDDLLHESLQAARSHKERLVNELYDDYVTKLVVNGVVTNSDGTETWEVITDLENGDLSKYSCFVCNDIFTGLNHKISTKEEALSHINELRAYVNNIVDQFRESIIIKQRYVDESGKYSIWVTVNENT